MLLLSKDYENLKEFVTMGFVDLHVHSDASDGTFTPSQVVELAKNAGLDAIALTDHDTTAGVNKAL